MARFSSVVRGALAREPVRCTTVHGTEFACDVRAFSGVDDALLLQRARSYAIEHGIEAPKDGDPLYEQGKWIHTILLGCVDPDSPPGAPVPYFDGGAKDVLECLDRDRMAFLVERQARVQDAASFGPRTLSPAECIAAAIEMAEAEEGDELPFERWRPSMQRAYLRFSARLLATLAAPKSGSISVSNTSAGSSSTSPPDGPAAPVEPPPSADASQPTAPTGSAPTGAMEPG